MRKVLGVLVLKGEDTHPACLLIQEQGHPGALHPGVGGLGGGHCLQDRSFGGDGRWEAGLPTFPSEWMNW